MQRQMSQEPPNPVGQNISIDNKVSEESLPQLSQGQNLQVQDLNLKSQKQLRNCIQLLQDAYNSKLQVVFDQLNSEIQNRPLYVMFEPLLNCNSLTDHEAPKNILPVYQPFLEDSLESLRTIFDEQLPSIIFDQFVLILHSQITHSGHQFNRIRDLEGELSQFQTQASIQAEIIKTLQQTIINEKQRFVKEITTLREQIVQKNRYQTTFQPDFNEIPQAADCLNMPDISLDLEQFKQHSSKEIRLDNNKLLDEIKQLKSQVLLLHGQAVEGEGFKKRYLASQREVEESEMRSAQAVQGYKNEIELMNKAKDILDKEIAEIRKDYLSLKEQKEFFGNQIESMEFELKEAISKGQQKDQLEAKYQQEIDQNKKHQDSILLKNNEVNQLRNQIDQLRSQITKLQKQEQKASSQQQDELQERIENITIVNDRLKAEIDRLMVVNQDLQDNKQIQQSIDLGGITLESPQSRRKTNKNQEVQVPEGIQQEKQQDKLDTTITWNTQPTNKNNSNTSNEVPVNSQIEINKRIEQFQMGLPWQPDEVDRVIEATFKQAEILRFVLKKESCKTLEMKKHMQYLQNKLGIENQINESQQNLSNLRVKNASFRKGKKPALIQETETQQSSNEEQQLDSNQSSRHSHRRQIDIKIKQNVQEQINVDIPLQDSEDDATQEKQNIDNTSNINKQKKSFRRNQEQTTKVEQANKQSNNILSPLKSKQQTVGKQVAGKLEPKQQQQLATSGQKKISSTSVAKLTTSQSKNRTKLPNTPSTSTKPKQQQINQDKIKTELLQYVTQKDIDYLMTDLTEKQVDQLSEKQRQALNIIQQQHYNIKEICSSSDQEQLSEDIQEDVNESQILDQPLETQLNQQQEINNKETTKFKSSLLNAKGTIEQQIKQQLADQQKEKQLQNSKESNRGPTQNTISPVIQETLQSTIETINQQIKQDQIQNQVVETNQFEQNNTQESEFCHEIVQDFNVEDQDLEAQHSINEKITESQLDQLIKSGLVMPSNIDQYNLDINPLEIIKNHDENEINQNLALQIRTVASFADLQSGQQEADDTALIGSNHNLFDITEATSDSEDITEAEAANELKKLLKQQQDEIRQLKDEIEKEKSTVQQLTDIDSYNPNTVSLQQTNNQWKRQLKGNTFIMDKLLGDVNLNDIQDVEQVILTNLKQNDEKVAKSTKDEVLEILNQQLQDQLLNFVFDSEINEDDYKSKYQQNFLDSIYDDEFIDQLLDQNLSKFKQELIQKAVYHPIMIKRILQKFNDLELDQKLAFQQLYDQKTVNELSSHQITPETTTLLTKLFFDQSLAQILCLDAEIPEKFISESKDLKSIAKSYSPTAELNLFQFGNSIKNSLILQKETKLHANLISKFQVLLGEEFYDNLHSGLDLTEERQKQLMDVVLSQETMQKLMSANFDVKTTKKLQKMYDQNSLVGLKKQEISPSEARSIIEIFSNKQVAEVLFGDQKGDVVEQIQQQVKQIQQIQKQEIVKKKIVKEMEKTLFDVDIAEGMLDGEITQDTANVILKVLYNEDMAKVISNNKYSMNSAKLLSNVLYNPEIAKALKNVEGMSKKQVLELAGALYNNEIVEVLQKETKDQQCKELAQKCARQAKMKQNKAVDNQIVAKPFQVRFSVAAEVEKQQERVSNKIESRHHMAAIQNTGNTMSGHIPIDQLVTASKITLNPSQNQKDIKIKTPIHLSKLIPEKSSIPVPYVKVPVRSTHFKQNQLQITGQSSGINPNYGSNQQKTIFKPQDVKNAMKSIQFDVKTVPANELMVRTGKYCQVAKRHNRNRPQNVVKQHPTVDMKGLLHVQNFTGLNQTDQISQFKKAIEIQDKIDNEKQQVQHTQKPTRYSSTEKVEICQKISKKNHSPMKEPSIVHQSKLLAPLDQFTAVQKNTNQNLVQEQSKKQSLDKIIEQLSGSYIGDGKVNLEGFSIKK